MISEQELDLRMAEPPKGSIIRFKVAYPDSPKTFTYAAVEGGGFWYVTGANSPQNVTWNQLITWLRTEDVDVINIARTTAGENLL